MADRLDLCVAAEVFVVIMGVACVMAVCAVCVYVCVVVRSSCVSTVLRKSNTG